MPAANKVLEKEVVPLVFTGRVARMPAPSKNEMSPVGVVDPLAGATVPLRVTETPVLAWVGVTVSDVLVVFRLSALSATELDVLVAKRESPE